MTTEPEAAKGGPAETESRRLPTGATVPEPDRDGRCTPSDSCTSTSAFSGGHPSRCNPGRRGTAVTCSPSSRMSHRSYTEHLRQDLQPRPGRSRGRQNADGAHRPHTSSEHHDSGRTDRTGIVAGEVLHQGADRGVMESLEHPVFLGGRRVLIESGPGVEHEITGVPS